MASVVVDAATREKLLANPREIVEVRDETGQVIGSFVAGANTYVMAADGMDISDEELDRRIREDKRFSAAEVMERLRSLGHVG